MSLATFFTRKRIPNPTQGNTVFVHGIIFDPGAEAWSPESLVADPAYTLRVFPQWNFSPMEALQPEMVFQSLSLPSSPPPGFPFAGVRGTSLMHESNYPDIEGDYFS